MPGCRGQDWRHENGHFTCETASPLQGAGLQICRSLWGGACCLSDWLSLYCPWQKWELNIHRMAGFFFFVFGLLVCVLWWAFLKSYGSLTLPVAHPTCLLSSFLHALLFLSLISPPRLPCWVLCGLTQLTCDIPLAATVGPGNGMNSTLASQDWWENVFPVNGMRISLCYWTQTKKLSPAASCDLECREQHTNMDRSCTLDGLWRHWPHSTWSLATSGLMNTHLWFSRQLESGFCSLWPNHFKYTKGLIYLFSKN